VLHAGPCSPGTKRKRLRRARCAQVAWGARLWPSGLIWLMAGGAAVGAMEWTTSVQELAHYGWAPVRYGGANSAASRSASQYGAFARGAGPIEVGEGRACSSAISSGSRKALFFVVAPWITYMTGRFQTRSAPALDRGRCLTA